jgi:hypothetical protein
MPILLIKRILARYPADSPIAVVAPFHPSQCIAAESRELPVTSPLAFKRKQDVFEFEMPQKRRKLSVDEQATTVVAVEEPWLTFEDVGSDYVKLLEHRWKASTTEFDAAFAQRKATQAKTNLLQCEKALCDKFVQKAQAELKAKERELQAVTEKDKQAMATLTSSFADARAITDEWASWQGKSIDKLMLLERVASKGSHRVARVSDK